MNVFAGLGRALFSIACLLGVVSASALAVGQSHADFTYEGPSSLRGSWTGRCDARGILLPAGLPETVLSISGGRLVERTAYVNRTLALGGWTEKASGMKEKPSNLVPGPLRLQLAADSLLIAFPAKFPAPGGPSFAIDWKADHVFRSAAVVGHGAPGGGMWFQSGETTGSKPLVFQGPTIQVEAVDVANATGSITLYVRYAKIENGPQAWPATPYETERSNVSSPAAAYVSLEVHDVLLELEGATWALPSEAGLVCSGGNTRGQGEFVADAATGRLASGPRGVVFAHRALSIAGEFDLNEDATEKGVQATATGELRSASLDFAIPVPTDPPSGTWVAIGTVALAALLVAVLKFAGYAVGFYYSRVGRDRALDNANRDYVYDAVRANPGVDLERLAALTSLHRATIAYHVRVLQRVGLVATVRRGKSVRVLERGLLNARDLPRIVASHDPGLAFVTAFLSGSERPLKEVAEAAMARFDLTRRGAYRLISRAVREGVVQRRTIDGEVRVACEAS